TPHEIPDWLDYRHAWFLATPARRRRSFVFQLRPCGPDGFRSDDGPVEQRHPAPPQEDDEERTGKDAADMRAPGDTRIAADDQHVELLRDPEGERDHRRQRQRDAE